MRNFALGITIGVVLMLSLSGLVDSFPSRSYAPPIAQSLKPVPTWVNQLNCVEPNIETKAQIDLALEILEKTEHVSHITIGAYKYLARRPFQDTKSGTASVCSLDRTTQREILSALRRRNYFRGAIVHLNPILVLRRLGPFDADIQAMLERTAFAENAVGRPSAAEAPRYVHPNEFDLRPLARSTLAEFGSISAELADRAMAEIDTTTLGTSAAQLAVAGNAEGALEKTERIFSNLLEEHQGAIPRDIRDRMYELAYAISYGGDASQKHLSPIIGLLDRKILSAAPPFGLVELSPARMCDVLEHIGGEIAAERALKPPCDRDPRLYAS